jgi:hypothetical protein
MMTDAATAFAAVLTSTPDPVVAPPRAGTARPGGSGDVPAVTIGVVVDPQPGTRWSRDPGGAGLAGALQIEVWGTSAAQAAALTQALEQRVRDKRDAFRERGFAVLRPLSLEPIEELRYEPASGSPFPVRRQRLSYAFVFQAPPVAQESEGGPIKRVDVDLMRPVGETLTIS